ncbi:hypothetical protein GGR57DRAFT_390712 [Xylariaceae sp. FL1272]|nr:hypothetical protein GGR57DRAFT_390712 [Xylariaceae sp. FL1272]
MDVELELDCKGIGEGLVFERSSAPSPSDTSITLSDTHDQSLHKDDAATCERSTLTSLSESDQDVENAARPLEALSTSAHGTRFISQLNETLLGTTSPAYLTLVDTYCRDIQAHEMLAVGQTSERQSQTRLPVLNKSLNDTVNHLIDSHTKALPISTSSSESTPSDVMMTSATELEHFLNMEQSSEWRDTSLEEQTRYLCRTAKLRRRLQREHPREVRSPRLRKRRGDRHGKVS